ncbi:mitochondrial carrier domain-containing protein [Penicillium cinerascens]|uniref:Mitochondrial carrier domain-containing protein n=1 Tax=Penicillium cinerascens TaxID=70096 RepID=A0A9W9NAC0_9EURO|nr:mitochondrial carrier domain-containing protein [Penicillium cinerascens]KAJ5216147.1 mitochondrial carrier domain-containing protein [Penicillium cinerascens]
MATDPVNIFLASTATTLSLDFLIHPLDTIKTRLQSREYISYARSTKNNVLSHPRIFRGLYQGFGSGAFFITYENVQSKLAALGPVLMPYQPSTYQVASDFCAASVAEAVACVFFAPAEALKNNAQMIQSISSVPASANSQSHRASGVQFASIQAFKKFKNIKQLWSGYFALLAHHLPYTAIQMPLYEVLKGHMAQSTITRPFLLPSDKSPDRKYSQVVGSAMIASVSGAISGGIAAVLTAPTDMVKTRVNLDAPNQNLPQKSRIMHAARNIFITEGFRGFFRGCGINIFMSIVGSGMWLGLYEGTKSWLSYD